MYAAPLVRAKLGDERSEQEPSGDERSEQEPSTVSPLNVSSAMFLGAPVAANRGASGIDGVLSTAAGDDV
jgi:hypothetical protein